MLLIGGILTGTSLLAQTTTFDYLNSSLSTSDCNVFSPTETIEGSVHQSHAGGVGFDANKGFSLVTRSIGTAGATAFVINYNFATGYNYDITITASENASTFLKTSVVSSLNPYSINSTSTCQPG